MDLPLVSIIIPVFNSELYITRCIESITSQTYINFEVIIIDDGSTDLTPFICNNFAEYDPRIMIINKPNGGVSSARNIGLKSITGDFITFIDSDDYIKNDYLESLVNSALLQNADLVSCGCTIFNDKVTYTANSLARPQSDEKLICALFDSGMGGTVWGKLIKSNIIFQNKVFFNEQFSLREDLLFWCELSKYINSHLNIDYFGYFYYRPESNKSLSSKYDITEFDRQLLITEKIQSYLIQQQIPVSEIENLIGKDISRVFIAAIKKQIRTGNFTLNNLNVMFNNEYFEYFKIYIQIKHWKDFIFIVPIKYKLKYLTYLLLKLRYKSIFILKRNDKKNVH